MEHSMEAYRDLWFTRENACCFLAKAEEEEPDCGKSGRTAGGKAKRDRETAWVRKRMYKKALYRRFLMWNPAVDLTEKWGTWARNGICLVSGPDGRGSYVDYRNEYRMNPVQSVYISPRGDVRKYCGISVASAGGNYALGGERNHYRHQLINRRIRRIPVEKVEKWASFGFYEKLFDIYLDENPW